MQTPRRLSPLADGKLTPSSSRRYKPWCHGWTNVEIQIGKFMYHVLPCATHVLYVHQIQIKVLSFRVLLTLSLEISLCCWADYIKE
jgi:hypothetical protein